VGFLPITVNGSEARSRGLELQANARLSDHWLLDAQYTYTDAALTRDAPGIVGESDSDPSSPTYDGARKDDRLPGSPKHAGSVTASYLYSLVNGWDFRADYGIRATSDVLTRAGARGFGESLAGFALHRAAFSLTNQRWTARLHVENLLDRFAETSSRSSLKQLRTIGSNDFTVRSYYKGVVRPRTIGLDLSYNFDW
jgi:outer membrane receptor protein involved in Fe transport